MRQHDRDDLQVAHLSALDRRPTSWNKDDEINYSHALARRLPAEVLYDAIHRATGSVSQLPGLPAGARAAQLLDSHVEVPGGFLDLFGKPPRESACECERSGTHDARAGAQPGQRPVVGDAIKDPNNRIAKLVATEKDDAKVIEELYLAVLCRLPTPRRRWRRASRRCKDGEADYDRWWPRSTPSGPRLAAYEKTLPTPSRPQWESGLKNAAGLDAAGRRRAPSRPAGPR